MAADVGRDVVRAQLLLDQLHGGEDRPFGAAGAEAGRPRRHDLGQRTGVLLFQAGGALEARTAGASMSGIHCRTKAPIASPMTWAVYSPAMGNRSLPESGVGMPGLAQDLC